MARHHGQRKRESIMGLPGGLDLLGATITDDEGRCAGLLIGTISLGARAWHWPIRRPADVGPGPSQGPERQGCGVARAGAQVAGHGRIPAAMVRQPPESEVSTDLQRRASSSGATGQPAQSDSAAASPCDNSQKSPFSSTNLGTRQSSSLTSSLYPCSWGPCPCPGHDSTRSTTAASRLGSSGLFIWLPDMSSARDLGI